MNGIRIYHRLLPDTARAERAGVERAAVLDMVREVFGRDADYVHDEYGAPAVTVAGVRTHEISVSHCKGLVVLAVAPSGVRIGIDAETPREQLIRLAKRFLSPAEQGHYSTLAQLTVAWTHKEAVFKASGERNVDFATELSLLPVPTLRGRTYRVESVRRIGDATVTCVVAES